MKKILFLCIFFVLAIAGYSSAVDPVTTVTQPYFTTNQVDMSSNVILIKASNVNRTSITICNIGSNTVYIGNTSSVASTTGKRMQSNECITMDRNFGVIYGVCAAGLTSKVDYLEE